ncbi:MULTISPECIES: AraC family transcriptional regulator [unclassified Myroides]|uniref:AraC family transcriptional regulator n=1 Tax=unclassified Myroides TaxID=2642485 RepID=UPI0015F8AC09|nr:MULTISPECIES: AraC family transcriptional regulator [unclassified Myroides]MBB1150533.1 helix-turn-helix domain-containing protein [Myroides sp. NP-2]MDM1407503.1 helix-turn-helix domain-containing protein [Myroides sp. DF42-4-2]
MKNTPFDDFALFDSYGNKYDFILLEIEQAIQLGSSYSKELSKQDFLKVIYITEGEGIYYADLEAFEVKKGDVCFVSNFHHHHWNFSKSIKGYVINFKSAFLTKFITNHMFLQELAFFNRFTTHNILENNFSGNRVESAIQSILHELKIEINKDINLIRIYLLEILFVCKRKMDRKNESRSESVNSNIIIDQFEQLIENHFYEYKFPKEYAKHLVVTPNYLNSVCRKMRGKSAGDMIRDRILLESKRLLISTNLSASEIAYRLNFKDSSYFTRFFKKYVYTTPDEFRRNN